MSPSFFTFTRLYTHYMCLLVAIIWVHRVSFTINSSSVAMVTAGWLDPLSLSRGLQAHAHCAVPLGPISYFNRPNKRVRDIRNMATALAVSGPRHITEFATTRFSFTRLKRQCHTFMTAEHCLMSLKVFLETSWFTRQRHRWSGLKLASQHQQPWRQSPLNWMNSGAELSLSLTGSGGKAQDEMLLCWWTRWENMRLNCWI